MKDREKVIRGLECCIDPHVPCGDCPYYNYGNCDPDDVRRDALTLLKEQEPRVLTLEEAESLSDGVWTEIWSPSVREYCLIYARVSKNNNFSDYENLEEDSGTGWIRDRDNYNKNVDSDVAHGWRCWTSRPTEEQRRKEAWDA